MTITNDPGSKNYSTKPVDQALPTLLPSEVHKMIILEAIQPISTVRFLSGHLKDFDLAFFPTRDQGSLDMKTKLCLVSKLFYELASPLLLSTVHLFGRKDIQAFHHGITREGSTIRGEYVKELSLGYIEVGSLENEVTAAPSIFRELSEVFAHLRNLTKLDLTEFMENMAQQKCQDREGFFHNQKLFWSSIPTSITHVICRTPWSIPISSIFCRLERKEFKRKHDKLCTWSFRHFPNPQRDRDCYSLVASSTSFEVLSMPKPLMVDEWDPVLPRASHLAIHIVRDPRFWGAQGRRENLRSVYCVQPPEGLLPVLLRRAPNLSWIGYRLGNLGSIGDRGWNSVDNKPTSLEHVVLFINPICIISPSSTFVLADNSCAADWTFDNSADEYFSNRADNYSNEDHVENEDVEEERIIPNVTKALAMQELDRNCGKIYQGLQGLLDRDCYPKLQDISLVLNPFPGYPRQDIREIISASLQHALSDFEKFGTRVIVLWGESRRISFLMMLKVIFCSCTKL